MANNSSLRIIGGIWRSRRIQFINSKKIRPTPDRVRETLFNWLASDVEGADCLDLFAGSGALAFEAVSRGARHATLVEEDGKIIAKLKQQKQILQADAVEVIQKNALSFVREATQQYDIVFLDPPFHSGLLAEAIPLLLEKQLLSTKGLMYVESASNQPLVEELKTLNCIREKTTGEVHYALYAY